MICHTDGAGRLARRKPSPSFKEKLTVEMIELDQSYTSLKKLLRTVSLPAQKNLSTPTSVLLSSAVCNSSWEDIPLKDPIVKQAAWAYLQPAGVSRFGDPSDGGGVGRFFRRVRERCVARSPSGEDKCGCLTWIHEVIFQGKCLGFLMRKNVNGTNDDGEEENIHGEKID